jgi:hypothetical protein
MADVVKRTSTLERARMNRYYATESIIDIRRLFKR